MDTPMFLPIVRQIGCSSQRHWEKENKKMKTPALYKINAQGMTEGVKKQKTKSKCCKKDSKSVE